ncbi:MAG TPA: methionyl-tRNA formyltransferase [Solirubrobacteraceae bacterium]|jgi:methionyl-tRNA formyltransferase
MGSGRPASLSGGAQPVGGRRIVFLGTSEFAAAVLEALAGSPHSPVLALTRPDRPAGRGRRLSSPPVADTARALQIPLEQPDSVNDPEVRQSIAAVDPDAVVVCAFGALIKEPLLSDYEILNLHPSLLPRWRGAAPIERAIMAGDTETGVSIMRLTAGLDSGPVCLTASEPISPEDTYGTLAPRLQVIGGELLAQVLNECPEFVEQEEAGVTYAEKVGPEDRLLDPARTAVELERVVRALHPHIGARLAREDGSFLGVHSALVVSDGPLPGALALDGGRLLYGTADGALELTSVQPPGGRPMDGAAYIRGHAG